MRHTDEVQLLLDPHVTHHIHLFSTAQRACVGGGGGVQRSHLASAWRKGTTVYCASKVRKEWNGGDKFEYT